jgi:hypothetical protein
MEPPGNPGRFNGDAFRQRVKVMGIREGSSGFCVGGRVEVEASTVEVDGRLEVLSVPEAVGHFLDGLDLGVEALRSASFTGRRLALPAPRYS